MTHENAYEDGLVNSISMQRPAGDTVITTDSITVITPDGVTAYERPDQALCEVLYDAFKAALMDYQRDVLERTSSIVPAMTDLREYVIPAIRDVLAERDVPTQQDARAHEASALRLVRETLTRAANSGPFGTSARFHLLEMAVGAWAMKTSNDILSPNEPRHLR